MPEKSKSFNKTTSDHLLGICFSIPILDASHLLIFGVSDFKHVSILCFYSFKSVLSYIKEYKNAFSQLRPVEKKPC